MSARPHLSRRQWLHIAGAATLAHGAGLSLSAQAQDNFPSRLVRIIVPLPVGGAADVAVRVFAEQMQRSMKQSVIVENKPGGLYTIGLQALASSPADGYTLMHVNSSMTSVQASFRKIDMLKQMMPITEAGQTPALLIASTKAPFKTAREMVDYAKTNPGKLNYAVGGAGSGEHLLTVMMELAAGFKATVVPFKGGGEAMIGLMAGDTDFQIVPAPLAAQFLPKGGIRVLAAFTAERVPQFPDVPTIREVGIDMAPYTFWGGFVAPVGTPAPVLEILRQHISAAVMTPEIRGKLDAVGITQSVSASREAFTRQISDEIARLSSTVKAANLKFE